MNLLDTENYLDKTIFYANMSVVYLGQSSLQKLTIKEITMVLIFPPPWTITILLLMSGVTTGYIGAKLFSWFPDFFLGDTFGFIFKAILPLIIWICFVLIHIGHALSGITNSALSISIGITLFVMEFIIPLAIIFIRTLGPCSLEHRFCHI